ncbi:hypothetical protein CHARACLAT_023403 [Characodon lateralis]|uniref:Uncharacterized protein n=1 Tax=Characodon lateralis TaxID=208331 RepID=A0ABU7D059_9TELE|nr:hypothetical protein [Characodon lateralis]
MHHNMPPGLNHTNPHTHYYLLSQLSYANKLDIDSYRLPFTNYAFHPCLISSFQEYSEDSFLPHTLQQSINSITQKITTPPVAVTKETCCCSGDTLGRCI